MRVEGWGIIGYDHRVIGRILCGVREDYTSKARWNSLLLGQMCDCLRDSQNLGELTSLLERAECELGKSVD